MESVAVSTLRNLSDEQFDISSLYLTSAEMYNTILPPCNKDVSKNAIHLMIIYHAKLQFTG